MHIFKKITVLIFTSFIFFSSALSDDQVSFLDVDIIMQETVTGKKIIKNLNELNKKNISLLRSKEEKLKNLEKDIKQQKNIISEDETNSKIKILQQEISKFRSEKEKLLNEFNTKKNEELNAFFIQATPLIQKYIKEKNISIILDKKNIFMGNQGNDITKDIINLLNKNL